MSLANMHHKLEQAEAKAEAAEAAAKAAAEGGAPPGGPATGMSPASGAAIKRRASVTHYQKALSDPDLPARMREMARAKLSESEASAAGAHDQHASAAGGTDA